MYGLGGIMVVLGVLAMLFTGQLPGFEGKNFILGIALIIIGAAFIIAAFIIIEYMRSRPRNISTSRQTVTDDGTGRPVVHEENNEIRNKGL